MTKWNVIVVGAGPAGALAAYELATAGVSKILLVDKAEFPRAKVCGCCLNGAALDQLKQAGLLDCITAVGIPLKSLQLYVDNQCLEIPLPSGLSVSRDTLDHTLVLQAVQRGVTFKAGCTAVVQSRQPDACVVQLALAAGENDLVETDVVIVADGLGGTTLQNFPEFDVTSFPNSKIGVGCRLASASPFFEPNKIYMSYGSAGYAGVVALEDGTFDLAAALNAKHLRATNNVSVLVEGILAEAGVPSLGSGHHTQWRGTKPLTSRRKNVASHRIFVIGDSASYVEPFTGEGIAWAFASARALAPVALRAVRKWDDLLAAEWRYLHRRVIHRRQSASKLVAGTLRQRNMSGALAAIIRKAPFVVSPVVHSLNSPIEVR